MVRFMHKEQRRDQIMVNVLEARGHLLLDEIRGAILGIFTAILVTVTIIHKSR